MHTYVRVRQTYRQAGRQGTRQTGRQARRQADIGPCVFTSTNQYQLPMYADPGVVGTEAWFANSSPK